MMFHGGWPDGVTGYNPITGKICFVWRGETREVTVEHRLDEADLDAGRLVLNDGCYVVERGRLVFREHERSGDDPRAPEATLD